MSGKRHNTVSIPEEEYRRLHEAEMRARFMQTDIPGVTPGMTGFSTFDSIWHDARYPTGSALPTSLEVIRTSLVGDSVPQERRSSPAMPPAVVQGMRPFAAYLAEIQVDLDQLQGLTGTVAPPTLPAPPAPPAWYQRTARDLVARLEKTGFAIQAYDPEQHAIVLTRTDGSKIVLHLQKANFVQAAERSWVQPPTTPHPSNKMAFDYRQQKAAHL